MEKIDSLGGAFPYNPGKKKEPVKKKEHSLRFSSLLVDSEDTENGIVADENVDANTQDIEDLLDDVFELGEKLGRSPTLTSLSQYKRSIRKLLEIIIKRSLTTEQTLSGNNVLKRKKYTVIKVIDTKLESLAADVLTSQKENIDLLAKIDEIHGLIVDLIR